jgi:acetyl-CoA acetyltransferase
MRDVVVLGVGMHPFGKHPDKSLYDLARVAIWDAIRDANVDPHAIQHAYVSNSLSGPLQGLENTRGQFIMREAGFSGLGVTNVENACASATTALRGACLEVASGASDVAIAVGVEKMLIEDRSRVLDALTAAASPLYASLGYQFTAGYAMKLKKYMRRYGVTREQLAEVVVKNTSNGALNEYAFQRTPRTVDEVLQSRTVADPLTLFMCCPNSDGAAAAIVCRADTAARFTRRPLPRIRACAIGSGRFPGTGADPTVSTSTWVARQAYETAGIGPGDVDLVELHDAMAPAELIEIEELGICGPGEAGARLQSGEFSIGGRVPVSPSGGLVARGHPVGATGLAQIAEIVWQLRGSAGPRQVQDARVGLALNQGGRVDTEEAACYCVTILEA